MLCRSRACECSVGMHNMLIVDMLVCTVVSNVPVLVLGLEMTRELLPSLRSLLASPLQSWAASPILSPSSSRHRIVLAHCAPPAQPGHAGPRLQHPSLVTHHLQQSPFGASNKLYSTYNKNRKHLNKSIIACTEHA